MPAEQGRTLARERVRLILQGQALPLTAEGAGSLAPRALTVRPMSSFASAPIVSGQNSTERREVDHGLKEHRTRRL